MDIVILAIGALFIVLSVTLTKSVSIGGRTVSGRIVRTAEGEFSETVTLAAGKAGTLSTRTDDNTGTLTLGASHGITTGQIIDLYWSGGIRRTMTVGTVAGTSVPIDLGVGDVLPAAATAIVACVQTVVNFDFDGDEAILVAASATRRSSVEFQQDAGTVIKSLDLGKSGTDGEAWDWANNGDVANPFVGVDVGKVVVSNGSSAGTNTVVFGAVLDNVA